MDMKVQEISLNETSEGEKETKKSKLGGWTLPQLMPMLHIRCHGSRSHLHTRRT